MRVRKPTDRTHGRTTPHPEGLNAVKTDSDPESHESEGLNAIPRDVRTESHNNTHLHRHRTGSAQPAPSQNG